MQMKKRLSGGNVKKKEMAGSISWRRKRENQCEENVSRRKRQSMKESVASC